MPGPLRQLATYQPHCPEHMAACSGQLPFQISSPNVVDPQFLFDRRPDYGQAVDGIRGILSVATSIRPYLQNTRRDYGAEALARDMATPQQTGSEFLVAHDESLPEHVLAFAYFRRLPRDRLDVLRRTPAEYIFEQLGVTDHQDLRRNDEQARRRLLAATALISYSLEGKSDDTLIYVHGYEDDTRTGFLFKWLDFRLMKGWAQPRQGESLLVSNCGAIRSKIAARPELAFTRRNSTPARHRTGKAS